MKNGTPFILYAKFNTISITSINDLKTNLKRVNDALGIVLKSLTTLKETTNMTLVIL